MTDDTRGAIVGAAAAGLAVAGTLRPLCVLMQVADDQPRELDERFRTSGIGSLDAAASLATGGRRRVPQDASRPSPGPWPHERPRRPRDPAARPAANSRELAGITRAQYAARAQIVAGNLARLGVERGDTVAPQLTVRGAISLTSRFVGPQRSATGTATVRPRGDLAGRMEYAGRGPRLIRVLGQSPRQGRRQTRSMGAIS